MRFLAALLFLVTAVGATNDAARLDRLFAGDWAWQMSEFPERASMSGYAGARNERWTDLSRAAIERRKQHPKDNLAVLDTISPATLTPSQLGFYRDPYCSEPSIS
jgi:uncharacterized protein (DUF885 family)